MASQCAGEPYRGLDAAADVLCQDAASFSRALVRLAEPVGVFYTSIQVHPLEVTNSDCGEKSNRGGHEDDPLSSVRRRADLQAASAETLRSLRNSLFWKK
jgi:hypothetical protein